MASAKFQLSSDGGLSWLAPDVAIASASGIPYNAGGGNASVYARLSSTAGVDTIAWSIVSASENAPLLTLTVYPDKSVRILVPKDTSAAWLLRVVVNGGVDPLTKRTDPRLVSALAIKVLTATGIDLLAPGECDEGNRTFGWTKAYNAMAAIAGTGGGGGSALPSPFTATLVGGNLRITAPSSATPKSIDIWGQDASSGTGGGLRFAGGDGSTKGPISFGYVSAGTYNETLSWDQTTLQLAGLFKLTNRLLSVSGGIASTPWDFKHDYSATTFATALAATLPAYRLRYLFSDKTVTAFKVEYDRVTTEGMLDLSLPIGSTLPAVRVGRTDSGGVRKVWSELYEIEQSTTDATPTEFFRLGIPVSSIQKITVDSLARVTAGGNAASVSKRAAIRRDAGAPVPLEIVTMSTTLELGAVNVDFVQDVNDLVLKAIGVSATNIIWRHRVEVFYGP